MLRRTGHKKETVLCKNCKGVEKSGNRNTRKKETKVLDDSDIILFFGKITLVVVCMT